MCVCVCVYVCVCVCVSMYVQCTRVRVFTETHQCHHTHHTLLALNTPTGKHHPQSINPIVPNLTLVIVLPQ